MEDFASVGDLEARWRVLDTAEQDRAEVLLHDASVMLAIELRRSRVPIDPDDELQSDSLTAVCCQMVRRVMVADSDKPEYTQETMSAGAFSQTYTLPAGNSNLYLTKAEKLRLGIGHGRVSFVRAHPKGAHDAQG